MLSCFRVFLQITDQIRVWGSSIRQTKHPDVPLLLVEIQPTCQSARGILGLVVETRGKRSRLGGSRGFRLGGLAAFLHVSLSSSADVSLCPSFSLSVFRFPPIHLHFLFLKPQWGCQTGSLMFPSCPVLKCCTLCLFGPATLSVCSVPITHFCTQVLTVIISSGVFCLWVMYCLFSVCISHQGMFFCLADFFLVLDVILVIFWIL